MFIFQKITKMLKLIKVRREKMKKKFRAGKIVLASMIAIPVFGEGVAFTVNSVSAETIVSQSESEQVTKQFIDLAKIEDWDSSLRLMSEELKKSLSKEGLLSVWTAFTRPFGEIVEANLQSVVYDGVHTKVKWVITTKTTQYALVFKLNEQNEINDFHSEMIYPEGTFLTPVYDLNNYVEKQIVIGDGDYSLPGILTVPEGEGPFPVVVLVHGSGANDMDSTFYYTKPFRDLAVGLASKGIAVLRYDKRTKTHGIRTSLERHFTIQEETVMDANQAVDALLSQPDIDPERIFVLGHSQGAFALPLIVKNDVKNQIKGIIGAAGPAGKFHHLLLWQVEQQLERAKQMNAPVEQVTALEEQMQMLQEQFKILEDPQYSFENIPPAFQLQPISWWFDLREYEPTVLANEQEIPYLILHGEKDIQVPMSEFEKLKMKLKERDNTQFKSYSNMFHTLADYAREPDGMTEYLTPGNVSEELIADVATWIKNGKLTEPNKIDPSIYKDYKDGLYWSEAITWALNEKILFGSVSGKVLQPNKYITEIEYLRVLFRYVLGPSLQDESAKNLYVLAKNEGLSVTENTSKQLTRGDAALLLGQVFVRKDITKEEAVQWLYDANIIQGYTDQNGKALKTYASFKPEAKITRAHLVTILHNLHQSGMTDVQ